MFVDSVVENSKQNAIMKKYLQHLQHQQSHDNSVGSVSSRGSGKVKTKRNEKGKHRRKV